MNLLELLEPPNDLKLLQVEGSSLDDAQHERAFANANRRDVVGLMERKF